jgi:hypothetical protein
MTDRSYRECVAEDLKQNGQIIHFIEFYFCVLLCFVSNYFIFKYYFILFYILLNHFILYYFIL